MDWKKEEWECREVIKEGEKEVVIEEEKEVVKEVTDREEIEEEKMDEKERVNWRTVMKVIKK